MWLARRQVIGTVCAENGYLPGTMQLDRGGVNFDSSWTPLIAAGAYRDFPYDPQALESALQRLREGGSDPAASPLLAAKPLLRSRLVRELCRLGTSTAWQWRWRVAAGRCHSRLPAHVGSFVPLPLQVERDAQLSCHSPWFGSDQERLVQCLLTAMHKVLPQHRLVVKLHPKETRHVRQRQLQWQRRWPELVFVKGQPIRELLPRCAMVVMINSTVGVEALAFGKPVVALGRNFYTTPALVELADTQTELEAALLRALAPARDHDTINHFPGYLQQQVLTRGSYRDGSTASRAAIGTRLLTLFEHRDGMEATIG